MRRADDRADARQPALADERLAPLAHELRDVVPERSPVREREILDVGGAGVRGADEEEDARAVPAAGGEERLDRVEPQVRARGHRVGERRAVVARLEVAPRHTRATSSRCLRASRRAGRGDRPRARSRRPPRAPESRPSRAPRRTRTAASPRRRTARRRRRSPCRSERPRRGGGASEHRLAAQLHRQQVEPRIEPDDELAPLARDRLGEPVGEAAILDRRTDPTGYAARISCRLECRRSASSGGGLRRKPGDDEEICGVLGARTDGSATRRRCERGLAARAARPLRAGSSARRPARRRRRTPARSPARVRARGCRAAPNAAGRAPATRAATSSSAATRSRSRAASSNRRSRASRPKLGAERRERGREVVSLEVVRAREPRAARGACSRSARSGSASATTAQRLGSPLEVRRAGPAARASVRGWPQLADEAELLERRLELRPELAPLDPLERAERSLDGRPLAVAREVGTQPRPQVARLADVEDGVVPVAEEVDARRRRRAGDERSLRRGAAAPSAQRAR